MDFTFQKKFSVYALGDLLENKLFRKYYAFAIFQGILINNVKKVVIWVN